MDVYDILFRMIKRFVLRPILRRLNHQRSPLMRKAMIWRFPEGRVERFVLEGGASGGEGRKEQSESSQNGAGMQAARASSGGKRAPRLRMY